MIYSKTVHGRRHYIGFKPLTNLSEAKLEEHSCYYYDQHDQALRALQFNEFIDEVHWDHLRRDPTAKILLYYGNEYFNMHDIERFVSTMMEKGIPDDRLYVVTLNEAWERWAKAAFEAYGMHNVNIDHYNLMVTNLTQLPLFSRPTTHKFSSLSRNFTDWRLRLFAELAKRQLLDNFVYTFHNINPYTNPVTTFGEGLVS